MEKSIPKRNEIITKEIQSKIKKLLRAVIEEGTGIKASKTPINIWEKQGLAKNRDAWFIGCAKDYVVGVWVGRDDDKSMKNVFGSTFLFQYLKK